MRDERESERRGGEERRERRDELREAREMRGEVMEERRGEKAWRARVRRGGSVPSESSVHCSCCWRLKARAAAGGGSSFRS